MAIAASFKNLNKNQQLAILIGAPVLLAVALGYLTHKALTKLGPDPKIPNFLQRPGGTWATIQATDVEIEQKEVIIAMRPSIERTLASLKEEIKENQSRLPREAEKTEMRQLIEKYAREIPSDIGTVHFNGVPKILGETKENQARDRSGANSSDYQAITYQTEIEGDLNGIIYYVNSIEKNTRFLAIKSMDIKPVAPVLNEAKDKILHPLHQVKIDIVTYVYTPPQPREPLP